MGQKNTGGKGVMTAKCVVKGPDGRVKGTFELKGEATKEQFERIQKAHKEQK